MEHQALGSWTAVIAAGGEAPPGIQSLSGQRTKALVEFRGVTSVRSVVDACTSSGCSAVVACDPDVAERLVDLPVEFANAGRSNVSTAANGVAQANREGAYLFLPSDVPLIRSEHLIQFMRSIQARLGAKPPENWFAIGLSSREAVELAHPKAPFTYLGLQEGQFASGGLYAASRSGFEKARGVFERASKDRKSQFRLVMQFGLANALRYLTGRMSIAKAEEIAGRVLGGTAVIVSDCHPDTTVDFDTVEDYEYLQSFLK